MRLARAYRWLCRAEAVLAAVLLVAMVALIFTGGVARMARQPLNWTTDFATCCFAWAAFLAADVAWRKDALMSVDLLTARLPKRWRARLAALNHLLIAGFLVFLICAGIRLAILSSARSFQGVPWISYSWVTMSLPVGAALLLLTTALKLRALRPDG
jgi:TRAP-type C4-dicarboxylate transport system permease small subunit